MLKQMQAKEAAGGSSSTTTRHEEGRAPAKRKRTDGTKTKINKKAKGDNDTKGVPGGWVRKFQPRAGGGVEPWYVRADGARKFRSLHEVKRFMAKKKNSNGDLDVDAAGLAVLPHHVREPGAPPTTSENLRLFRVLRRAPAARGVAGLAGFAGLAGLAGFGGLDGHGLRGRGGAGRGARLDLFRYNHGG